MNTKVSINEQIRLILIENSEVLFGIKIDENLIQFQKTRKEVEGDVTLVIFPFVKALKCSPIEAGNKIGDFLKEKLNSIASFEVVSGFLNLSINSSYWIEQLKAIEVNPLFGFCFG